MLPQFSRQSAAGQTTWRRVSRPYPCPVCERPDWCLVTGRVEAPTAAICARIESAKRCGEAGWLHLLRDDDWRQRSRYRSVSIDAAAQPTDLAQFAHDCEAAFSPSCRELLACELGVSGDSLLRLRVGWCRSFRAYTFPMSDVGGNVRGIRLRAPSGRKWSVKGGHEGLFLAADLRVDELLLICEGPTDTAALFDLGFAAVGRPSCSGGVGLVVELLRNLQACEVAIVADGDLAGQRGATNLAAVLAAYSHRVRIVTPPAGVKDAREWRRRGATRDDVLAAIGGATAHQLVVTARRL